MTSQTFYHKTSNSMLNFFLEVSPDTVLVDPGRSMLGTHPPAPPPCRRRQGFFISTGIIRKGCKNKLEHPRWVGCRPPQKYWICYCIHRPTFQ